MIHFSLSTACEIVTTISSQYTIMSLQLGYKIHKVLPLPADTDDVDSDGVQLPFLLLRLQLRSQLPAAGLGCLLMLVNLTAL